MKKRVNNYNKARVLRLSEKNWQDFVSLKPRDKSWDLFIKELIDWINYPKSL